MNERNVGLDLAFEAVQKQVYFSQKLIMLPNDGIFCFSTMIQTLHLSEEATQTEESGNSTQTDYGQIDDSSTEEESVIERLSRLFSVVRFFFRESEALFCDLLSDHGVFTSFYEISFRQNFKVLHQRI